MATAEEPSAEPLAPGSVGTDGPPLDISVEYDRSINYAMQQNDVPVVKRLQITNEGSEGLTDLDVTVSIDGPFATPWRVHLSELPPGGVWTAEAVDVALDPAVLVRQAEREATRLVTEIRRGDDLLATRRDPLEILAYNEWPGLRALPETLAAFVMPNHPETLAIVASARARIEAATGDPSFSGYQSRDPRRVLSVLGAIYDTIVDLDIGYVSPPASFELGGQKIRSVDQVIALRQATCLDLCVMFAGVMEAVGLHGLILLTREHAFVGAWLVGETFANPTVEDLVRVRKRVDLDELVVYEATALTRRPHLDFDAAVRAAQPYLEDEAGFRAAIDIRGARRHRIRPLPLRLSADRALTIEPTTTDAPEPAAPVVSPAETTPVPTVTPEPPESADVRLDRWKRRLLDLSLRNRLINHRDSKRSLPILCTNVTELEDTLAGAGRFLIHARPDLMADRDPRDAGVHLARTGEDAVSAFLREEQADGRLHADLTPAELERRLVEMYRTARFTIEETGANTLYLAIGFLHWYETTTSETPRRAPVLLLPVRLDRKTVRSGFSITLHEDEPRLNVTLLEKLRQEFGLDIEPLAELPTDDDGVDVERVLRRYREAVRDLDRWEIREEVRLGFYAFTKFLMWRDLRDRTADLKHNPVVRYLLDRPDEPFGNDSDFCDPELLDDSVHPNDTLCPLDADSSQLTAVVAGTAGASFVLEGPPGTGKSQTITNLIAQALSDGRRVLFVSEKMAALHVVRRRLAAVGLGPFCLELHSNKASKKAVLAQLEESLALRPADTEADWNTTCGALFEVRGALNDYVESLHRSRPVGRSVYDALGTAITLRDAPEIDLGLDPARLDAATLSTLTAAAEQLRPALEAVGPPHEHPLRGIGRTRWETTLDDRVRATTEDAQSATRDMLASIQSALDALTLPSSRTPVALSEAGVAWLLDLAAHLTEPTVASREMLTHPDWTAVAAALHTGIAQGEERAALREELAVRWDPSIVDAPLPDLIERARRAETASPLVAWWARWRARRAARPWARGPIPDNLADALDRALRTRDLDRALRNPDCVGARLFGLAWNGGDAEWARLREILAWAERFRELLATSGRFDPSEPDGMADRLLVLAIDERERLGDSTPRGVAIRSLLQTRDLLRTALDDVGTLLEIDATVYDAPPDVGWLPHLGGRLRSWCDHRDRLDDWCYWRRARGGAIDAGLGTLVESAERGDVEPAQLRDVLDRACWTGWVASTIDSEEELRGFNRREHENRIERFRRLDRRHLDVAARTLQRRLAERVPTPSGPVAEASEMGILERQLRLQRRHMPVRRLIERLPNLLPRLKPCFLMSPLSVAQFLDAAHPAFDLVVFDEASQIPVWDAVGAIARGTSVVVVGDSKQLPPTTFFMTIEDEEPPEDEDYEEVESILDECVASGLPSLHLRWHYRSRHERLIDFSNRHYYGGDLYTFPNAHELDEDLGVEWRRVDEAVYDRGRSRTNEIEARAVVDEAVTRLQRDPDVSLGIVTFSLPQQRLVEDLLDVARRDHPELERFFTDTAHDPVFVKNLENVQGDERDVILFSIGYGPDAGGRFSMSFGPLNRDGGERRLNVAITRARRKVIVFTSFAPERIDLTRTRSIGVAHLKAYLEYAASSAPRLDQAAAPVAPGRLPTIIRDALRERGWTAETHVGCSGFRLDVAVRDRENPDRFTLGLLLDGPYYRDADTARDRDRLRESVLEHLGWRLLRVWARDWWLDPERQLERIENLLRAPRHAPPPPDPEEMDAADDTLGEGDGDEVRSEEIASSPMTSDAPVTGSSPYRAAPAGDTLGDVDAFHLERSDASVRAAILEVVDIEAPIHVDLVGRRVASFWDLHRVTSRVRHRVRTLIEDLAADGRITAIDEFAWRPDQTSQYTGFRIPRPGEPAPRRPEEIPPVEIANAAAAVLAYQFGLPRDDLAREIARLFGFHRFTTRIRPFMLAGITLLADRGGCRIRNDQVEPPVDRIH